jgi:hypothetical protein
MTNRNYSMKLAAVTGAVALLTGAGYASAQTSVDALLNKLEQKGILSVDEAKELKAENQQDSENDFNKALSARFPMPSWVTSYKLSGDFRGRFEKFTTDSAKADRDRMRYRLRAGLTVSIQDNMEVGFRLASGDPVGGFSVNTGNPVSANTTLQDNFTRKFLYLDTAYGKWTPIHNEDATLSTTIGKMDNPFRISNMVIDYDIDPEGLALQSTYQLSSKHSLVFNAAGFVMDEEATSSHDPAMFAAQLLWDAKWTPKVESSLGLSGFDIVNRDQLTTANVPYYNQGNTRTAAGALVNNYNPIIGSASLTYKLASFPFYKGEFPITFAGEYMDNPGASTANVGYRAGITLGKAGKKNTWSLMYRYQELQADAWYDAMEDDDNTAFYFNAPPGGKTGYFGGTNVKGHLIILTYSFTDSLSFAFTGYLNQLVNSKPGGVAEPNSRDFHCMADFMWKF